MNYHLVCNTRYATSEADNINPSGAPEPVIGFMRSSFSFQCRYHVYLIVFHFVLFYILKLFSCTVCCMSAITVTKLVIAYTAGFRYAMVLQHTEQLKHDQTG